MRSQNACVFAATPGAPVAEPVPPPPSVNVTSAAAGAAPVYAMPTE